MRTHDHARCLAGGFRSLLLTGLFFAFLGCGSSTTSTDLRSPVVAQEKHSDNRDRDSNPDFVKVRGRWEIHVEQRGAVASAFSDFSQLAGATASHTITGSVVAAVTFTVTDANFVTPISTGVASYGRLDISALRDNSLRVCGPGNNVRCTNAGIRLYSTGTLQKGLWNAVDAYGAPIASGAQEVGLDVAGAAVLSAITIGNGGVLKLTDFSASGPFQIPVSVDFSDAPAGSYSSTLVVEYYLY